MTLPGYTVAIVYGLELFFLVMVLIQAVRVFSHYRHIHKNIQRRRLALLGLITAFTIEAAWFGASNIGFHTLGIATFGMRSVEFITLFKSFGVIAAMILFYFYYIDRPPKKK